MIQRQFSRQTQQFSAWPPTRNTAYLKELAASLNLSSADMVLDVGCGTGELACCCATQSQLVHGTDLTESMVAWASRQAQLQSVGNVRFLCADGSHLPYRDATFSVVASKSAFHHMPDYGAVFREMVRCCRVQGIIGVEDIVAYEPLIAQEFFDRLDTTIDQSHHARIPKTRLMALFNERRVELLQVRDIEVEIAVEAYRQHAVQSEEDLFRLERLVAEGVQEPVLAPFLYMKAGHPVFVNKGVRLIGRKC